MNLLKTRNDVIKYTVNKKDYNNLYISVQNGEVVINAPWYMASSQIQEIVEEKRQWILSKINEYEQNCENKKEYIKLKEVKVLGKNYDLVVKYKMVKSPNLSIEEGQIRIVLPNSYKKMENSQVIEIIINKMYDMVTKKKMEEIMEKTRVLTGIAPEDYNFKRIDNVLAKCEEGRITINPDIAQYKTEVIEYIVLHEFCHLKYKKHTKSFYDMLKTYMPNYEKYANEISKLKY